MDSVSTFYADHITEGDRRFLSAVVRSVELPRDLPQLLGDPRLFDAILGEEAVASGRPLQISPFLLFAVVVQQADREFAKLTHTPERTALRQRIPVFDTPQLAEFLATPARRLFLIELLASFTRIASGRYRVRSRGGWQWRRFSDLDPVRLAGLLEAVPEAERPGIYRRLGDVALFLTGVFPDYAGDRALSAVDVERLLRASGMGAGSRLSETPALELFETLGARWYRTAWQLAPVRTSRLAVVTEVAERFRSARRVLNHLTDRYLFPVVRR